MKLSLKFIMVTASAALIIWGGISLGSSHITWIDTLRALFGKPLSVGDNILTIVWDLRFPRVVLAFMIGGSLALSGGVFQSVLKNPLCSPYILGVSAGASLGAGLVILTKFSIPFVGSYTLPLTGFAFGIVTIVIVIWGSSRLDKTMSNNTVILFGMVFSLFVNAALTTLTGIYREEMRNLIQWQMGSFAMKDWSFSLLMLPFLMIGCVIVIRYSREMDILTFGDDDAESLGVDSVRTRRILLASSAALAGAAVSLSGAIGFVDLIAPHLARRLVGSRHRYCLPMAFLLGGSLTVTTDLIARTALSPIELPVGAVTALVGAPFFAWVYFRKR